MHLTDVPFHRQKTAYTCGPASLRMAFEYFGECASEEELARLLLTDSEIGTRHNKLIDIAVKRGFYCYVNNESTIFEIQHFISRDLPVIVHFLQNDEDNEGHYALVVGVDDEHLVFNDPWSGNHLELRGSDFLPLWQDPQGIYKQWLMVVSRDDLKVGRQFLPKDAKLKTIEH